MAARVAIASLEQTPAHRIKRSKYKAVVLVLHYEFHGYLELSTSCKAVSNRVYFSYLSVRFSTAGGDNTLVKSGCF